jgi:hypothetical protein
MGAVAGDASWTRVLRRTLAGTQGLTLARLNTQPPEVVFSPAMIQPAPAPGMAKAASSTAANLAPSAATLAALAALDIDTVYRHRAELTVGGDLPRLLAYLKSLEAMPRDLHWIRVNVTASEYPQATAQLTLFTLSRRAETPFN